jgi:ribonuclease-3
MHGGRTKKSLLVDALEAVIAAVYLDGGAEAARNFVNERVMDAPVTEETAEQDAHPAITDFKGALRELAAARGLPEPHYTLIRVHGPEHSRFFTVEVHVGKEWTGQAEGRTKKVAAQRAAREVHERLVKEAIGNQQSAIG